MRFRCFSIYIMFSIFIVGCSGGYTKIHLSGVTKSEVDQTLLNVGGYNELVSSSIKKVNKQKIVVEYDDTVNADIFSYSRSLVDTIKIEHDEPNNIIVSLQCKESQFLRWGMYRDKEKEHRILWNLVQELQEEEKVSVEWIGDWKPRNEPIIVTDENTKWIAFYNDAFVDETDYLDYCGPEFIKSNVSINKRVIFHRWTDREATYAFIFSEPGQESYEKILIKPVSYKNASDAENTVIVIGIAAKGTEYERMFTSDRYKYTDISDQLLSSMMNRIVNKVFWGSSDTLFIDPTPWIEKIELPNPVNQP